MKRLLAVVSLLGVIGAMLAASGIALADQTFHTLKVPLSSSNSTYPLKDGFVISTHMNGPIYFEKKEFQLHGAKPDTHFFLYRDISFPPLGLQPAEGSFWTDKNGNGHITTNQPPEAVSLMTLKSLGIDHVVFKNVLYDGLPGEGGTPAYESEPLTTYVDFKWTPDLPSTP